MIPKHIETIIHKYLSNEASEKDIDFLADWIKNPDNQTAFEDYVKFDATIYKTYNKFNASESYKNLIKDQKKTPWFRQSFFKYAAMFVGVGLTAAYFYLNNPHTETKITTIPDIQTEIQPVTLQMANGEVVALDNNISEEIVTSEGDTIGKHIQDKLSYAFDVEEDEDIVYNKIYVPYGNKFNVELSDGTMVHLNAGTTFEYPTAFGKSGERRVYLSGEAYFEVTTDKAHPFVVSAKDLNVKVYGTAFNFSAYSDDTHEDVVLVEGAVTLKATNNEDKVIKLNPGYKGSIDKLSEGKTISIEEVNTYLYTSWIQGVLTFRNKPFKNILKKLEREFNVTIINNNKKLNEEVYNASFKHESIEKILSYFKETYDIKIRVEDNIVYID